MSRTFSLLGFVMFAFGVVALSSLARQSESRPPATLPDEPSQEPQCLSRPSTPLFAFDTPFSLN